MGFRNVMQFQKRADYTLNGAESFQIEGLGGYSKRNIFIYFIYYILALLTGIPPTAVPLKMQEAI